MDIITNDDMTNFTWQYIGLIIHNGKATITSHFLFNILCQTIYSQITTVQVNVVYI